MAARYEHQTEINQRIEARLMTNSVSHWSALLTEAGLQNEQVLDYPEFLAHPHVEATELISWLDQPGFGEPVPMPNLPGPPRLASGEAAALAPTLGQHTEEILAELARTDKGAD